MSRTFQLTDGTTTISFLSTGNGFVLSDGGGGRMGINSVNDDLPVQMVRIVETYVVDLVHSSHDNFADAIQDLRRLARKAKNYRRKKYQTAPVYLVQSTSSETNARRALVYRMPEFEIGDPFQAPFEYDPFMERIVFTVVRGIWRAGTPGTLPTALTLGASDGPASPTEVVVANHRVDYALSHIYNYDASLTAWSSNLVAEAGGFNLFSVSGSTPAVNDLHYAGAGEPFFDYVLKLATAGNFSATIQIQYWNGSWTAIPDASQLNYPDSAEEDQLKNTGHVVFAWTGLSDWAKTTINGQNIFWIRLAITAFTSWTTSPAQATQAPYSQASEYIELPAASLLGDRPGFQLWRMKHPAGGSSSPNWRITSKVIMGARNAGLTNFVSRINLGNQGNPAAITVAVGTDGAFTADESVPGGYRLDVSFTGDSTMVVRGTITLDDLLDDYAPGEYRVFLTTYQNGGAAGDCNVKLRTRIGSTSAGDPAIDRSEVATDIADKWHVLEVGTVSVPFGEVTAADTLTADLIFQILAERTTGAATLRFGELILIPVDLWTAELADPKSDTTSGGSALRGSTAVDLDGGVLLPRSLKYIVDASGNLIPAEGWDRDGGPPPQIEPGILTRVYFLILHYEDNAGDGSWYVAPWTSDPGKFLVASVYDHPVYEFLRGGE